MREKLTVNVRRLIAKHRDTIRQPLINHVDAVVVLDVEECASTHVLATKVVRQVGSKRERQLSFEEPDARVDKR